MQRKVTKTGVRGPNKMERDYLGWLKHQPSCLSGLGPVEVHHCIGSSARIKVNYVSIVIGHAFCIALTPDEHRAFGQNKKAWRNRYGLQYPYALNHLAQYEAETGIAFPIEVLMGIEKSNC